jgi:hypothetical protein
MRLSGSSGGFPFEGNLIYVRLGDDLVVVVATASVGGPGGDVDLEALTRKAVGKAEAL